MNQRNDRILIGIAVLALTAGGAALRLHDLGSLGFFGDEETTALAARSLAEGHGSAMPSGMPYRRALPYTWLNALSAEQFGLDEEIGYRVPAALLGAVTIPLMYCAGAAVAGPAAGLAAALLLATSGWHLVWSRTARMYVPALLAALAFFWVAWRWQVGGRFRELMGACGLYLLAVFLHSGAAAIVLFPVVFALLYDGEVVSLRSATLASIAMATGGWILDRRFVVAPYERWASGFSAVDSAPAGQLVGSLESLISGLPAAGWMLLPVGFGVGWLWARSAGVRQADHGRARSLVIALLSGLSVTCGFAGLPYAAVSLGIAALLLDARGIRPWWQPAWATTFALGSAIGLFARAAAPGSGLSDVLRSPFPYLPYLATLLPLFAVLFGLFTGRLALTPGNSTVEAEPGGGGADNGGHDGGAWRRDDRPLRAAVLFVLAYCLALGFAISWAPWRYLLIAYPWLLLVVAAGIAELVRALAGRLPGAFAWLAWPAATALLIAGAIGGHGLPASFTVVRAEHGTDVPWNDPDLRIRPDHRSPGRYVRLHAKPGDVVIAEDALEQTWYAGRVDYWFRSEKDAGRYLYRDPAGVERDIYVAAKLLPDPPPPRFLEPEDSAVWLITSGETADARGWYLSSAQKAWLDRLEQVREPAHRGEDGLSAVYCFGLCP